MKEKMYTICKITAAAFCFFLLFTIKNVYADDSYTFQINYICDGGYWVQDAEGNKYYDNAHNPNPLSFTTTNADTPYELTAPVREGYHFTGWSVDSRYAGTITDALAVENQPDETGTLTESTLIIHGFSTEDPTETQELQSQFEFLQNLSGNACYTLTAQWEKNIYTVTFNSRGGSPVAQQTVQYWDCVMEPADPTRDDFSFDGWYTDDTFENDVYDFYSHVTKDMTLYAGWFADFYLGIYNQDNPGADYCCGTIDIEEVPLPQDSSETTFTPVSQPIRDLEANDLTDPLGIMEGKNAKFTAKPAAGFTFVGWYEGIPGKNADGETIVEKPSEVCITDDAGDKKVTTYTTTASKTEYICAVFKCAEHHWGEAITVAPTKTTYGRIYQKCTNCGVENLVDTLPKISDSGNPSGNTSPNITKIIIDTGTSGNGEYLFVINRKDANTGKANPLKIKARKITVKYNKLRKKSLKIKFKKAVKFINKGVGRKTYIKIKGNGKIQINRKTGKITIKKGLKKGTYKVKILVVAEGNKSYKVGYKTVTCKIKVR